jgi:acyl dehydratase
MAHTYDQLQVGEAYSATRRVTVEAAGAMARIIGDAPKTRRDEDAQLARAPIMVPGMLLLGIISGVLGRDFPGQGSIAVGLSYRFVRPVPVGSKVEITIEVMDKHEQRGHITVDVSVQLDGENVLRGEGTVIPPPVMDVAPEPAREIAG